MILIIPVIFEWKIIDAGRTAGVFSASLSPLNNRHQSYVEF
jgi:hypothetical protein